MLEINLGVWKMHADKLALYIINPFIIWMNSTTSYWRPAMSQCWLERIAMNKINMVFSLWSLQTQSGKKDGEKKITNYDRVQYISWYKKKKYEKAHHQHMVSSLWPKAPTLLIKLTGYQWIFKTVNWKYHDIFRTLLDYH